MGGIYREHQLLMKPKPNLTLTDQAQLERWGKILSRWKSASKNTMCTIIGDLNIDHLRWQDPDQKHKKLVDKWKEVIGTLGFAQIIEGHTRT